MLTNSRGSIMIIEKSDIPNGFVENLRTRYYLTQNSAETKGAYYKKCRRED